VPISTKSLLVPATALLATLLLAAKSTSPSGGGAHKPRPRPPVLKEACPSEMELVRGTFCIDRFEASTVEIRDDGTAVPHSPFLPVKGLRVKAVSQKGVVPQAYISRNEAESACLASGKRLCTDREWITACKGPSATKFPYGNERHPGYCVDTDRVAPLNKLFSGLGGKRFLHAPMNDPRLNQVDGTLAPTGAFANCTNAFHVYDMVGNLHEWTADPKGTFRGGYYLDTRINGDGCNYRTVAHEATYHDYSTGFRCCANPK
jgi:formylglycine-generating enzyme